MAFVRQTVRRNTGEILKVKGQQEMDNRWGPGQTAVSIWLVTDVSLFHAKQFKGLSEHKSFVCFICGFL